MIDLVAIVFFVLMSYRSMTGLSRESAILKEFGQTQGIKYTSLLFPLGPMILLAGTTRLAFPVAYLIAIACYIPGLLVARNCSRVLEVAGTDKVQAAQESVRRVLDAALLGVAYVIVTFALVAGALFVA